MNLYYSVFFLIPPLTPKDTIISENFSLFRLMSLPIYLYPYTQASVNVIFLFYRWFFNFLQCKHQSRSRDRSATKHHLCFHLLCIMWRFPDSYSFKIQLCSLFFSTFWHSYQGFILRFCYKSTIFPLFLSNLT